MGADRQREASVTAADYWRAGQPAQERERERVAGAGCPAQERERVAGAGAGCGSGSGTAGGNSKLVVVWWWCPTQAIARGRRFPPSPVSSERVLLGGGSVVFWKIDALRHPVVTSSTVSINPRVISQASDLHIRFSRLINYIIHHGGNDDGGNDPAPDRHSPYPWIQISAEIS